MVVIWETSDKKVQHTRGIWITLLSRAISGFGGHLLFDNIIMDAAFFFRHPSHALCPASLAQLHLNAFPSSSPFGVSLYIMCNMPYYSLRYSKRKWIWMFGHGKAFLSLYFKVSIAKWSIKCVNRIMFMEYWFGISVYYVLRMYHRKQCIMIDVHSFSFTQSLWPYLNLVAIYIVSYLRCFYFILFFFRFILLKVN